jgi:hypothetical protein
MEALLVIGFLLQALIFGFFSAFIAREKGRSYGKWFLLGSVFSILAILTLIAIPKIEVSGKVGQRLDPASKKSPEKVGTYTEARELSSSAYQIYLIKNFNIEKNQILNKYTIENEAFEDLMEALSFAHHKYEFEIE